MNSHLNRKNSRKEVVSMENSFISMFITFLYFFTFYFLFGFLFRTIYSVYFPFLFSVQQEIVDHETWIFDLAEANANSVDSPNWFKEYTFKDAYGLPDLSPKSLNSMMNDWLNDTSNIAKVSFCLEKFLNSFFFLLTPLVDSTNFCFFLFSFGNVDSSNQMCSWLEDVMKIADSRYTKKLHKKLNIISFDFTFVQRM